jgi:hypothetical protein
MTTVVEPEDFDPRDEAVRRGWEHYQAVERDAIDHPGRWVRVVDRHGRSLQAWRMAMHHRGLETAQLRNVLWVRFQ